MTTSVMLLRFQTVTSPSPEIAIKCSPGWVAVTAAAAAAAAGGVDCGRRCGGGRGSLHSR